MAPQVDYTLYLVTGRELLPTGKDFYESLEESLQGGVTIVQLREKHIDTGEFVEIARKTKQITDKYGVPLIINDRLDVCLAVGASGLHIGQTDLPISLARSLLPPSAILGQSVSSPSEALAALKTGLVDYLGVGPVWWTGSKDLGKKEIVGVSGVGEVLDVIAAWEEEAENKVGVVAIGGIHLPNLPHLLHGSTSPHFSRPLDGIAVISDIVSSLDPKKAATDLRVVLDDAKTGSRREETGTGKPDDVVGTARNREEMLDMVAAMMGIVREHTPLAHQMTNNVVTNDSANVTLAMGASPIMADNPQDVVELSPAIGGLLINLGTISDKEGFLAAGRAANRNEKPIVLDPVAVGATSYRKSVTNELLSAFQPTIIKGNAAEIGALSESLEVASRGVDAVGSGFADPAGVVKALARKRQCIIVLTGEDDYVSDGKTVVKLSNGHHYLEKITGSGCMTGTAITIYAAAARLLAIQTGSAETPSRLVVGDMLAAAVAGCLIYTIAAEIAANREDVKGPGTFRSALVDELYGLTEERVRELAKVVVVL